MDRCYAPILFDVSQGSECQVSSETGILQLAPWPVFMTCATVNHVILLTIASRKWRSWQLVSDMTNAGIESDPSTKKQTPTSRSFGRSIVSLEKCSSLMIFHPKT